MHPLTRLERVEQALAQLSHAYRAIGLVQPAEILQAAALEVAFARKQLEPNNDDERVSLEETIVEGLKEAAGD